MGVLFVMCEFFDVEWIFGVGYVQVELDFFDVFILIFGVCFDSFSLEEEGGVDWFESQVLLWIVVGVELMLWFYFFGFYLKVFCVFSLMEFYNNG